MTHRHKVVSVFREKGIKMRTELKYFYIAIMVTAVFLAGCDDEEGGVLPSAANEKEQVRSEVGEKEEIVSPMYFPPPGSDEWESVSPLSLGWDTTKLLDAFDYAEEKNSYSLLILHKGKIVAEEYWKNTSVASQHDLESVSKSLMGFVIGVLQQDGLLKIDDKVSQYLGEGWSDAPAGESDITLLHLLTMSSGLNEELKWVGAPGETWRYSHAAYSKLYDLVEVATGSSFREIFESTIFNPIGMSAYSWNGEELLTNARDIARFGLLILNQGTWKDKKIIEDEGYFADMLSTSQSANEAYGYLWWLNGKDTWYDDDNAVTNKGPIANTMPSDAVLAKGKRDQRIYVVPSLELVVIRQGGDTSLPEIGAGSFDVEFWRRLIDAVGTSS